MEQYGLACARLAPGLVRRPRCLAAVASRAWNCGIGAFKVSRLRKAINEDRWEDAAELMLKPDPNQHASMDRAEFVFTQDLESAMVPAIQAWVHARGTPSMALNLLTCL